MQHWKISQYFHIDVIIRHTVLYLPGCVCTLIVFFCLLCRCGLVALWMAAHLRRAAVDMDAVVQVALGRGFTARGEMFSGKEKEDRVYVCLYSTSHTYN